MAKTFQMPMSLKLRLLADFAVARVPRLSTMCQKQKGLAWNGEKLAAIYVIEIKMVS
jgi:hypothetical protein